MTSNSPAPVFCALDIAEPLPAVQLAEQIKEYVGGFKLGMEFFYRNGAQGYQAIAALGLPIFLDLKLHDIPNTIVGALRALTSLAPAPRFITLHATGGKAMLTEAQNFAKAQLPDTQLLAVTMLTSLSAEDFAPLNIATTDTQAYVVSLAQLAHSCGISGFVCSPLEVQALRSALPESTLMVPGISLGKDAGDQKRTATPQQALADGANYLVIGRGITAHDNPQAQAKQLAESL